MLVEFGDGRPGQVHLASRRLDQEPVVEQYRLREHRVEAPLCDQLVLERIQRQHDDLDAGQGVLRDAQRVLDVDERLGRQMRAREDHVLGEQLGEPAGIAAHDRLERRLEHHAAVERDVTTEQRSPMAGSLCRPPWLEQQTHWTSGRDEHSSRAQYES